MPNERNVAALKAILGDYTFRLEYPKDRLAALAEVLASRGVLVPSALTDEETQVLRSFGYALHGEIHEPLEPEAVRLALKHIASGEPVQMANGGDFVQLNSRVAPS